MKFILHYFAIIAVFFSINAMADTSLDNKIQSTIDYYRSKYKMPGLALSIKLPGETTIHDYFSGTDSIISKTPIDASSLFQIGGVSKSYTAAIILQLEAEEKLKLSDPLGKWITQYPQWKSVTVQQLLNETSGIYDYTLAPHFISDASNNTNKFSLTDLANIAYRQHPALIFKVGSQWAPSSTNYALLGLIIEKITGHSFHNEFTLRFQQPLNLSNTYDFPYPQNALDHLTHGYEVDGTTDVSYLNMSWEGPAGGVISNPHDMVIWVSDLFNGKVLQSLQLSKMTRLVSMKSGQPLKNTYLKGVGLGIEAGDDSFAKQYAIVYEYKGNTMGYRAQFVYLPCDDIIAALAINNVSLKSGEREKIVEEVLKLIKTSDKWQQYKQTHKNDQLPAVCHSAL